MNSDIHHSDTAIIARNTLYQFVAKGFSLVLSMVTIAIIARFLSVEEYGEFTLITTLFALAIGFADLRIEQIVVRRMSEDESQISRVIGQSVQLKLLFALIVALVMNVIIWSLPYSQMVKLGFGLVSVGLLINALQVGFFSVIQYQLKAYLLTLIELIARVFSTTLIAIGAWLGWHYMIRHDLLVYSFSVSTIVISSLVMLLCFAYWGIGRMKLDLEWRFRRHELWSMFIESSPLWIMGLLALIHYRADTIILSFFKGSFDVGVYGLAYRFLDVAVTLPPLFIASVYPLLARNVQQGNGSSERLLQKSFDFLLLLVLLLALLIFINAPYIIYIFGGHEFTASIQPLRWLCFAMIGSFMASIFVPYLVAHRAQKVAVWTLSASVVINLILSFILIPIYSYNGAAMATAVSEVIGLLLIGSVTVRRFGLRLNISIIAKSVISVSAIGIVLFASPLSRLDVHSNMQAIIYLFLISLVSLLVYTVIVWRWRMIDQIILRESLRLIPLPAGLRSRIYDR